MCGLCGPVSVRYGRTFTSGCWIDHVDLASHKKKFTRHEHLKKKNAPVADKYGSVSDKDIL